MRSSSASSSTIASPEELSRKSPSPRPPSVSNEDQPDQTDAHIMADTSKEVVDTDIEKGQPEQQPAIPSHMDPRNFPDGGWEAWLAVSGAFCTMFCSFGWINCRSARSVFRPRSSWNNTGIGVFQEYYQQNQLRNLSPSTISWIPSLETFMMFSGVGPHVHYCWACAKS